MKSKCPICAKARGKRDCLLQSGEPICPVCCAQTRAEDTCSDCRHFQQAQAQAIEKMKNNQFADLLNHLDPWVDEESERVLLQLENKNFHLAEPRIEHLLENHPDHYLTHYTYGCLLTQTNQIKESVDVFKRSIEHFPYFAEGWYNLAISYKNLVDIPGFIYAIRKVLLYATDEYILREARSLFTSIEDTITENNGISVDEYLNQITIYDSAFAQMESENYEEAICLFKKVLILEPNHYQSHGNLGICYAYKGDKTTAISHLEKALEIYPDYDIAIQNKALVSSLKEGEKLNVGFKSIHYRKELFMEE